MLNINSDIKILYSTLNTLSIFIVLWFLFREFTKRRGGDVKLKRVSVTASTYLSASVLALSLIFYFLNPYLNEQIPYYEWLGKFNLYVGIILPFIGLFIYYFYVQLLSHKSHKYIQKEVKNLKSKFQSLHKKKEEFDAILTYFDLEDMGVKESYDLFTKPPILPVSQKP